MERLESGALKIPYTGDIVRCFRDIVQELSALEALPHLRAIVDRLFPDGRDKTRDLRELALTILGRIDSEDKETFVRDVSTAIGQTEIPTEIEDVRIMSLHKSKGLSAPVTVIAGCVEGLLPRQHEDGQTEAEQAQHLEEQRRLFYVGITRVKAAPKSGKPGTLILTYSQKMPYADARRAKIKPASKKHGQAILHASRFIKELGPSAPKPTVGHNDPTA